MRSLIIVCSYHHHNTEKIARVFAKVLDAPVKTPKEVKIEELQEYDLIGFGSGIYSARHHESLLSLADRIPSVMDKSAFIFSTAAILGETKVAKDHLRLREKLQSKGYRIADEFSCKGYNTNSFLKYIGGMNKGRPNESDLKQAEEFAIRLKSGISNTGSSSRDEGT